VVETTPDNKIPNISETEKENKTDGMKLTVEMDIGIDKPAIEVTSEMKNILLNDSLISELINISLSNFEIDKSIAEKKSIENISDITQYEKNDKIISEKLLKIFLKNQMNYIY
jgi:phage tail tube protein FII